MKLNPLCLVGVHQVVICTCLIALAYAVSRAGVCSRTRAYILTYGSDESFSTDTCVTMFFPDHGLDNLTIYPRPECASRPPILRHGLFQVKARCTEVDYAVTLKHFLHHLTGPTSGLLRSYSSFVECQHGKVVMLYMKQGGHAVRLRSRATPAPHVL
jgi:hypothetical protein